jgi:hypothetical protein
MAAEVSALDASAFPALTTLRHALNVTMRHYGC